MTSHEQPIFGDDETISAVVMLPVRELPDRGQLTAVVSFLRSAGEQQGVDIGIVYEFEPDHPAYVDTMDELEWKWRPRAAAGFADHMTKELVPAGYLEVRP